MFLGPFLRSLVERGLDISEGLLVVIDGSKGLRGAVTKAFRRLRAIRRRRPPKLNFPFAAQYPAHTLPCQRFAPALADSNA